MTVTEIVFLILGVLILVASCFIGKFDKNEPVLDENGLAEKKLNEKEIQQKIEKMIDSRAEETIVKTDDYLSKISNEKIMAVQEFTDQIIEKIQNNHDEVVFMYDLLNQKDEEIKKTVKEISSVEESVKKTSEKKASEEEAVEKDSEEIKENATAVKKKSNSETAKISKKVIKSVPRIPDDDKNADILKLYKQGKSIVEISKALGIGQGEVKLVIDLYGA